MAHKHLISAAARLRVQEEEHRAMADQAAADLATQRAMAPPVPAESHPPTTTPTTTGA